MRVTILQTDLRWESPVANRTHLAGALGTLAGQTDLVVLPEMFTTGFSMNAPALAETMDGKTLHWLRAQADRLDAAVTGSFICRENGRFYNRLVFMRPGGKFECYDKRHLFALANEHETYTAGRQRLIVEWKGWRICPLICYDLRFPVWSRQVQATNNDEKKAAFDLLLYVANWPARRGHHWRALLPARAIENQCYVAAVNITGTDGNGHEYNGDSCVLDYSGMPLCQISDQPGIFTAKLSLDNLNQYRRQLPFLDDADAFQLQ